MASTILCCLCGSDDAAPTSQHPTASLIKEKPSLHALLAPPPSSRDFDKTASDVVAILCSAEKPGDGLARQLDDAVAPTGWSEWLAENILKKLEAALAAGREKMGPALSAAYEDADSLAKEMFSALVKYAMDHPLEIAATVLLSILAFGVLVRLTPFVLELLGFAELGPVEGTFAAWWESTYGGYIPRGSMFSFFQRLGMTWGRA